MPNHITNYLTIHADNDRVNEVLDAIALSKPDDWGYGDSQTCPNTDELAWGRYTMDFNKIIPMPDHIRTGSIRVEDLTRYGESCWHGWSLANWGTKWNAYESQKSANNRLMFLTAWSNVAALMITLSKKFPDVVFEYSCYDEDFGSQVMHIKMKNGFMFERHTPKDFSKEAYELIFKMTSCSAEDFDMRFDETKDLFGNSKPIYLFYQKPPFLID